MCIAPRIGPLFVAVSALVISVLHPLHAAGWPADNESYGPLGCKVFEFKGEWERDIDSSDLRNSTYGMCLTVATATILNWYQWPRTSLFDGVRWVDSSRTYESAAVARAWDYHLITGGKGPVQDCRTDDPELRVSAADPSWTGADEIKKLIWTTERSFGVSYGRFEIESPECEFEGGGYFPLQNILKNRFGYPNARLVHLRNKEERDEAAEELRSGEPVIVMECGHAYVVDAIDRDPLYGEIILHSTDYLSDSATMGWFEWQHFHENGASWAIAGLDPVFRIQGKETRKITYDFGDRHLPSTSNTTRRAVIRIRSTQCTPLGDLRITVQSVIPSTIDTVTTSTLYHTAARFDSSMLRLPEDGMFEFGIKEEGSLSLVFTNNDNAPKKLFIELHDFDSSHVLSPQEEALLATTCESTSLFAGRSDRQPGISGRPGRQAQKLILRSGSARAQLPQGAALYDVRGRLIGNGGLKAGQGIIIYTDRP